MRYYPIYVNLERKRCLVVGAGQVGRRKIASLAEAGAGQVLVVDVSPPGPDMAELLARPNLEYACRQFRESDLDGVFLVIASTSDEALNWRISALCAERGILCNIVDQPEKCSFIVPAVFTQGDLTVAISTGGQSPALARKIRQDLAGQFDAGYGAFLRLMGALRPLVIGLGLGSDQNMVIFRELTRSPLLEAIQRGDRDLAGSVLTSILPPELHDQALGFVSELAHGSD